MKDRELERVAKRILKKSKPAEKPKAEEPKTAAGWLRKAYVDHDPKDGAPKVGGVGYV
jgi:hypothetical protein|tara:strand:- start:784 stop:957 length:174 start_codon:yes stop_codon:yes gene_type:complete